MDGLYNPHLLRHLAEPYERAFMLAATTAPTINTNEVLFGTPTHKTLDTGTMGTEVASAVPQRTCDLKKCRLLASPQFIGATAHSAHDSFVIHSVCVPPIGIVTTLHRDIGIRARYAHTYAIYTNPYTVHIHNVRLWSIWQYAVIPKQFRPRESRWCRSRRPAIREQQHDPSSAVCEHTMASQFLSIYRTLIQQALHR